MTFARRATLPFAVWVAIFLAACSSSPPAPVAERTPASSRPAQAAAPAAPPKPAATPPAPAANAYTVRRGDTLYSIALDNGLDYRELAAWNGISDPNVIREGQVLALKAPSSDVQVRPIAGQGGVTVHPLGEESARTVKPTQARPGDLVTEPKAQKLPYSEQNLALLSRPGTGAKPSPSAKAGAVPAAPAPPAVASAPLPAVAPTGPPLAVAPAVPSAAPGPARTEPERAQPEGGEDAVEWIWPASGKVITGFSEPVSKGIDIAGKKGEPVTASASGRVVYIGEGLRGYGKLVIIKHNNTFLSAYAHNDAILVREGQSVTRGQKIAEIGSTGTDQTKLHFEIRQFGKPVDPLKFLPDRPS